MIMRDATLVSADNTAEDKQEQITYCHSCKNIMLDYDDGLYCVKYKKSVGLKDEACDDYS